LQRGDKCFPVARHKLAATVHRRREHIDHLFFITDVAIGVSGIGGDVGSTTAWGGCPTQGLLGAGGGPQTEKTQENPAKSDFEFPPF
jgi:hypothetical protein